MSVKSLRDCTIKPQTLFLAVVVYLIIYSGRSSMTLRRIFVFVTKTQFFRTPESLKDQLIEIRISFGPIYGLITIGSSKVFFKRKKKKRKIEKRKIEKRKREKEKKRKREKIKREKEKKMKRLKDEKEKRKR